MAYIPVQVMTAKATKEVIVSAGAIDSPMLLMLSGIGPRAQLDRHQVRKRSNILMI